MVVHHWVSRPWSQGAMRLECIFRTSAGMNGLATDLLCGIWLSSYSSSCVEKGTPRGSLCPRSTWAGPCQISSTNAVVSLRASSGEAGVPSAFRSWIFFLGCLGVYFEMIWCTSKLSCLLAARCTDVSKSKKRRFLSCLVRRLCSRLRDVYLLWHYHTWNKALKVNEVLAATCRWYYHFCWIIPSLSSEGLFGALDLTG